MLTESTICVGLTHGRSRWKAAPANVETGMHDEDEGPAGNVLEGFSELFEREFRPKCQLYLVSPLDVGGDFPDRLKRALDAGPVAAFQLASLPIVSREPSAYVTSICSSSASFWP